ncbi:MAG: hypothetical protein HY906_14025 [Deltaproteobacteria bacterium]|nr:hypothetical protein [Deltaproteobacteria bacterium]
MEMYSGSTQRDGGASADGAAWGGPSAPPSTGTRWQPVPTETCGRHGIAWVEVDEVCGATDSPDYLAGFAAPILRDGALVERPGETRPRRTLFAVDATHLWVLDVTDPATATRTGLVAGLGQPLAVEAHARGLLLAAGGEGLLLLDITAHEDPVKVATVALPGPALGVAVAGEKAYVAAGNAGLAVVDLAAEPPALSRVIPVPGFAAAAAVRDGRAYLAACQSLVVVDLATDAVLGQAWLEGATQDGLLVAPAKSVALEGNVAFVAAGRFGAVAVDVTDPSAPVVRGNCTRAADQSFYASGVRIADGWLYVAGGEWGILPVPLTGPAPACATLTMPELPPTPGSDAECTTDPPWQVLPWQQSWVPPPVPERGRDPVQTLVSGGVVYAFGDARRIGARAVEIRQAGPTLARLGRFEEPQLVAAVSARDDRVLVIGPGGGLFARDDTALLAPLPESPPVARTGVAGALLDDGRWLVATEKGEIHVEGAAGPIALNQRIWPRGLTAQGSTVLVPTPTSLGTVAVDSRTVHWTSLPKKAELPAAVAATDGRVVVAAPEWTAAVPFAAGWGVALTPSGTMAAHLVFDDVDILDASRWREALPRRLLAFGAHGAGEVAALGRSAGLTVHQSPPLRLDLPGGTYQDLAVAGDLAYVVALDRGLYRSSLVTVEVAASGLRLVAIESFTGQATSVAVDGERLYVGDGDRGVRVYQRAGSALVPLGILEVQAVAP